VGFLELVKKRKSVRKYSSRIVSRDIIDRCIEAARLAPSACNSQPWEFIVIDEENLRRELSEAAFSGLYSMNSFAREAPVLIIVTRERSSYISSLGGYLRGVEYSLIDIGIACEHLVLQAHQEGLGTCWLGWFNENSLRNILRLPRKKKIDIIISMGYPKEPEERDKKRRTLNEIRRFNR
jgi:nitroreductase